MKLYNTLGRKLEEIPKSKDGAIRMYNCGPTVYSNPHIGNLRAFVTWDVLARALRYIGEDLKRVMNITDVGHMVTDEDFGEDKMELGAKREGIQPIDVANKYIKVFLNDMRLMNIQFPDGSDVTEDFNIDDLNKVNVTRATEYIKEMIELIKKMEENGFTYQTEQAVYFDISKYDEYTKLSGQKLEENTIGAREEVKVDSEKRNPADFVLWMKAAGQYSDHAMKWESPWGVGFPGWHIECSAMGMSVLGDEIDIHTGGIEHIGVHHPNERAQNFGVLKKEVVKMWTHNEHLQSISGDKLAKSEGNAYTLSELIDKGFDPMDLRILLAINNYRVPLRFSIEVLENSRRIRLSILEKLKALKQESNGEGKVIAELKEKFIQALNNDLNVSVAFAVLNEVFKSNNSASDKITTIFDFDRVFGISLDKDSSINIEIPNEVLDLAEDRKRAREEKDFSKSDSLREEINRKGYEIKDLPNNMYEIVKK